MNEQLLAGACFFIISVLYSSVGHAGASGYLAVMALLAFTPEAIKPTSLILNIVVALIASVKFIKAGYFDRKIFLAFVLTSIPLSFLGGQTDLSPKYFKLVAGIFLIISSLLLLMKQFIKPRETQIREMPRYLALGLGSVIGFFSGLIGVGGGIFLSPILIMANWAEIKKASGVAALFILVNSIAGLAGHVSSLNRIDSNIIIWILAVTAGGFLGSHFGTKKFNKRIITFCLSLVLMSAGLKFVFVDFLK